MALPLKDHWLRSEDGIPDALGLTNQEIDAVGVGFCDQPQCRRLFVICTTESVMIVLCSSILYQERFVCCISSVGLSQWRDEASTMVS